MSSCDSRIILELFPLLIHVETMPVSVKNLGNLLVVGVEVGGGYWVLFWVKLECIIPFTTKALF